MSSPGTETDKNRLLVQSVWADWELREPLGSGQFGVVYKAQRKGFAGSSNAAIKIITIDRQTNEDGFSAEQTDSYLASVAQNYAREIQMMESVKGYSNIVNIDDYEVIRNSGGKPWYVLIRMELLTPLYEYLEEHPVTEEDIVRLGSDLCRALEICRARKIVHRDIKPANVFVNNDGVFKLGDFGVARQIIDLTYQTKTGTPDYMAPEVYNGSLNAADFERAHRADIYSVGMLLYWIANGRRLPFIQKRGLITADEIQNAFHRRMNGERLPPPANVSPRLQSVILKACSFNPSDRFQSADQLREALEGKLSPQKQRHVRPVLLVLLAVLLIGLTAVSLLAAKPLPPDPTPAPTFDFPVPLTPDPVPDPSFTPTPEPSVPSTPAPEPEQTTAEAAGWKCTECGSVNSFDDQFCTNCGKTRLCLECGSVVPIGDKYCTNCSIELGHWKCAGCGTVCAADEVFCTNCAEKRHAPGAIPVP